MLINRGCQKRLFKKKLVEMVGRGFNICGHTKGTDKLFRFNNNFALA